MWTWSTILAQDDDRNELYYIIAILIFGAVSALFEKIKRKSKGPPAGTKEPPVMRPTQRRPGQPPVTGMPTPPQARPSVPQRPPIPQREAPVRPVVWEVPQRGPAPPVRPAVPKRPPPRRPTPPVPRHPVERPAPGLVDIRQPAPATAAAAVAKQHLESDIQQKKMTPEPGHREVSSLASERHPTRALSAQAASALGSFRNLSKRDIRRAIVLNEILGPPVSLREDEHLWDKY